MPALHTSYSALLVALAVVPATAGTARSCATPAAGAEWTRAAPAELGLDAAKLQDALDFAAQSR